jgi:hypothetical protein
MARLRLLLQHVCSLLLLLAVGAHALKFDIPAGTGHDRHSRRCIRNFVSKDMLVVVTAIVDGYKGDGMQLNMHVSAGQDGVAATLGCGMLDARCWEADADAEGHRLPTRPATSMASPRTLPASSAPYLPRTPTPRLTCALRTS